jgi:hypothetical protein
MARPVAWQAGAAAVETQTDQSGGAAGKDLADGKDGPSPRSEQAAGSAPKTTSDEPTWWAIAFSIAMAAMCWGGYGPILHLGQMRMGGSRLRPFFCVGIAYFVIAVAAPLVLLSMTTEAGAYTWSGMFWSIAAGAAGAIGALGIIMAFNFGGKPVFVMPLIFGFAPVVNTMLSIIRDGTYSNVKPEFFACLGMVIAGAVTVLVFAPKSTPHPPPRAAPN